MNILTIIVLVVILFFGFLGAYRGLIRTALSLVSIVISILLVYILSPVISDYVIEHTKIDDKIYDKMYDVIQTRIEENADKLVDSLSIDLSSVPYLDKAETTVQRDKLIAEYIMSETYNKASQLDILDKIDLPGFINKAIVANNNKETYSEVGADNFFQYVARYMSRAAVKAIVIIVMYILCRIILFVIIYFATAAVRSIVIINIADKIGGGAAGLAMGVAAAWLILTVASVIMSGSYNDMVDANPILRLLDTTNILAKRIK
jgi:uncharacterized membrane protein required for colicin V production